MLLAVAQWSAKVEVSANLAELERVCQQLPAQRPLLLAIPEMFISFAGPEGNNLALAEPLGQGPIQATLSALCKQHGIWLVAGTIPVQSSEPERFYACSIVFDDSGQQVGHYNKIHLFDVTVADSVGTYRESARTKPGSALSVVETPFGRIGLTVCYDLRFPGLYMALAEQGVDIITVPSAFTAKTGEAHWQVLCQARAIEQQVWLIAPNMCGIAANGRQTWGHSLIVSPWGKVLADLGQEPGVAVVQFERTVGHELKAQMPVQQHNQFSVRWHDAQ